MSNGNWPQRGAARAARFRAERLLPPALNLNLTLNPILRTFGPEEIKIKIKIKIKNCPLPKKEDPPSRLPPSMPRLKKAARSDISIGMRLTVEIADDLLADACRILQVKDQSSAVAAAVAEIVRCGKARDFALLLGKGELDYPATNDEVEKLQG